MDLSDLKTVLKSDCKVPQNIRPDIDDAMLLMQDYGGKVSETSAIMQYVYQHYVSMLMDKDVSDILMLISRVEMHHHELLGETITKLGGDPIIGADYKYWNAGYVNYNRNLKEMLMIDINDEEQAIINYKKTITKLNNKNVANMIECIIGDEKHHIEVLTELLNMLNERDSM